MTGIASVTRAAVGVVCALLAVTAWAEIITDGSLGPAQRLDGPEFVIGADLGRQAGANLFHSFQTFEILQGERATFSGPDAIERVVSRVTGDGLSRLHGALHVAIAGADFYLLNPNGILVSEGASCDLPAALHLSTADALGFDDGWRFSVSLGDGADAQLSVAAPDAFGYTAERDASLIFTGADVTLPAAASLALEGPNIRIEGSRVAIPSGRLQLRNPASPDGAGSIAIAVRSATGSTAAAMAAISRSRRTDRSNWSMAVWSRPPPSPRGMAATFGCSSGAIRKTTESTKGTEGA